MTKGFEELNVEKFEMSPEEYAKRKGLFIKVFYLYFLSYCLVYYICIVYYCLVIV